MATETPHQQVRSREMGRDRRASRPISVRPQTLGDYFGVVRRRWIYVATLLPAAILIAVYTAFALPPMYLASGTIMLEQVPFAQDLVRTTVAVTTPNQQINLVRRRVMSIENLTSIVETFDPYPDDHELSDRAKALLIRQDTLIEKVDPITLEPMLDSSAFSIHYYNPNPETVTAVAERLVELFLSYYRTTRTERAAETFRFLQEQSHEVEQRVVLLEQRLADFKSKYGDAIPEAQARNLAALDRTVRDLDVMQKQMRVVEERKALVELQLTEISPNLFGTVGGWQAELIQLRSELVEAQRRYTDDHPDVRRLRRSIAALSERAAAIPESQRQAPPDNPAYLRLASQLETVDREFDALRASANRALEQIESYERRLVMAPDVEREYRQLSREHDIAQSQFRDIQDKLGDAALAQTLEIEDQGAQFRLIRAPKRPSTPDSPNRVGIILLGFVLGAALSVGMVALQEVVDPSIRSARDLMEITDIVPIGVVPIMLNRADRRTRRLAWSAAVAAIVTVMILMGSSAASGA